MKRWCMMLSLLLVFWMAQGVMAADKVRIATEGAYPPFNMKNAKGELIGFDVDIAKALCTQMKADCKIVAQDWDGIIPGLLAKKYDAIIASMSITPERQQKVAFTNSYYSNYLRFVAAKGSGLEISETGLKGKRLGAQRATIAAQYLEDNYRKVAELKAQRDIVRLMRERRHISFDEDDDFSVIELKVYDAQEAAYLDLKAGRIDALLSDIYPAYAWLQEPENDKFEFIGDSIDINDKIGIAVRKGDQSLADQFNAALKAIRDDGTYAKINAKYFPFDIF